jgi:hypothetical protein
MIQTMTHPSTDITPRNLDKPIGKRQRRILELLSQYTHLSTTQLRETILEETPTNAGSRIEKLALAKLKDYGEVVEVGLATDNRTMCWAITDIGCHTLAHYFAKDQANKP